MERLVTLVTLVTTLIMEGFFGHQPLFEVGDHGRGW